MPSLHVTYKNMKGTCCAVQIAKTATIKDVAAAVFAQLAQRVQGDTLDELTLWHNDMRMDDHVVWTELFFDE